MSWCEIELWSCYGFELHKAQGVWNPTAAARESRPVQGLGLGSASAFLSLYMYGSFCPATVKRSAKWTGIGVYSPL